MARGKTLKVVFKQNFQNQGMLLPPDLNDLIAQNHPVRIVHAVLEKVDISQLVQLYKPGGTSSYHPPDAAQSAGVCLYQQHLQQP